MIGITIDRNVNSIRKNVSRNTNPNISGKRSVRRSRKSFDWAASPLTAVVRPPTPPTVAGMTVLRMPSRAAVDSSSLPFPFVGISTRAVLPSSLSVSSDVPERAGGSACLLAQLRDTCGTVTRAQVVPLDRHVHGDALRGEGLRDPVIGLDDLEVLGQVIDAVTVMFMPSAGMARATSRPPASSDRHPRPPHDAVDDR